MVVTSEHPRIHHKSMLVILQGLLMSLECMGGPPRLSKSRPVADPSESSNGQIITVGATTKTVVA